MNVTVLGAGAWGTALAQVLHQKKHTVTLWNHTPERLEEIRRTQMNEQALPGVRLPSDWRLEPELPRAIEQSECVVVAVPSRAFREVTTALADYTGILVSVTKGIEYDTGLTMCGVLAENAPKAARVALSGPTLALEVARGIPTAIVAASDDPATAETVQQLLHRPSFRVYTNADPLGVEMGGALKNVVAIAAGLGDGLGFGDNSKAALITRGILEIRRLGVASGAHAETFAGLSGLGDLTVTCYSRLSRNRAFGERLGRGETLEKVLDWPSVAEGYPTARSAYQLARRLRVTTPIIDQIYALLYENKDLMQAVLDLTGRESKREA
ncbi:MAG TPA: NAD(P)H-dependent glycerol-3-phosphate dehydrogenase [Verrucomicrobiae bacterium]|nr:NAD(P)H-dependent glycerol-3-phosphate dehydrogenase [Verrucomicrobiae bacterium]